VAFTVVEEAPNAAFEHGVTPSQTLVSPVGQQPALAGVTLKSKKAHKTQAMAIMFCMVVDQPCLLDIDANCQNIT
jgi:hypothetical protein